jgi:hypothetical protein
MASSTSFTVNIFLLCVLFYLFANVLSFNLSFSVARIGEGNNMGVCVYIEMKFS